MTTQCPEADQVERAGAAQHHAEGGEPDRVPRSSEHCDDRADDPRDLEQGLEARERPPLLGVGGQALGEAVERLPGHVRGDARREHDEEDRWLLVTHGCDERRGSGDAEGEPEEHLLVDVLPCEGGDVRPDEPAGASGRDHQAEEPRRAPR